MKRDIRGMRAHLKSRHRMILPTMGGQFGGGEREKARQAADEEENATESEREGVEDEPAGPLGSKCSGSQPFQIPPSARLYPAVVRSKFDLTKPSSCRDAHMEKGQHWRDGERLSEATSQAADACRSPPPLRPRRPAKERQDAEEDDGRIVWQGHDSDEEHDIRCSFEFRRCRRVCQPPTIRAYRGRCA